MIHLIKHFLLFYSATSESSSPTISDKTKRVVYAFNAEMWDNNNELRTLLLCFGNICNCQNINQ